MTIWHIPGAVIALLLLCVSENTSSKQTDKAEVNNGNTESSKSGQEANFEQQSYGGSDGTARNGETQVETEESETEESEEFTVDPTEQRVNVQCGKPDQFNVSMDSYFYGGVPMPWDVMIVHKDDQYKPAVQCLGVIVQLERNQHYSNESKHVMTASNCLDRDVDSSEEENEGTKLRFSDMMVVAKLSGRKGAWRGMFKTNVADSFLIEDSYSDTPAVILKLAEPIAFGKNAQPICLYGEDVPIYPEYCYMAGYMRDKMRHEEVDEHYGVCAMIQNLRNVNHIGGPLTCIADGLATLYGLYVYDFEAISGSNKLMKRRALFADAMSSNIIKGQLKRQVNHNATITDENEEEEEIETPEGEMTEVNLGEFVTSENSQLLKSIAQLYPRSSTNATTSIGPAAGTVGHIIVLRNHYKPTIAGTATFLADFPGESLLVTNLQVMKKRIGYVSYIYTGTTGGGDVRPMVLTVKAKTEHIFFRNYKRIGISTLLLYNHIDTLENKRKAVSSVEGEKPENGTTCYTAGLDASGRVHEFDVEIIDSSHCVSAFPGQFHALHMYCVKQPYRPIVHAIGCPLICQDQDQWKLYASRAHLVLSGKINGNLLKTNELIVAYVQTQFKRDEENEMIDQDSVEEEHG
uniref:Peptidase S1 domain-containing protein n=1 Tax=Trichuris muris TaxID=70415 RepID=A0A5S6R127_TRIMR